MPSECQLPRTQVRFSLLLLDRKLSITFVQASLNALRDFEMKITRLRIRNQNKYYHNRGRADGLSGLPQN